MNVRILVLVCALLGLLMGTLHARPLLSVAVGAGLDVEPSRPVGMSAHSVQKTLATFSFEGEVIGRRLGLLVRGLSTAGSSDYEATGFDRLALTAAATLRPFSFFVEPRGYGHLVLRRLSLEAGLLYQQLLSAFHSSHDVGLHLGMHADFPFLVGEEGPFLRIAVVRPLIFGDSRIQSDLAIAPIEAGDPVVQVQLSLGAAF